MSVYSTLTLRKSDAIKLIAKELNVDFIYNDGRAKTENQLLEDILFEITSRNPHSPYQLNNYDIVENDYQLRDEWDTVHEPFS